MLALLKSEILVASPVPVGGVSQGIYSQSKLLGIQKMIHIETDIPYPC